MRVLYVNPGGDRSGGAERSLALLMKGLAALGHDLGVATLLSGNAAEVFAAAGATVLANGLEQNLGGIRRHGSQATFAREAVRGLPDAISIASTVRALASSFEADLIHTNGLRAHVLTPLLARHGSRVVWSLRERPPGPAARSLIRVASHGASAVIAPSVFAAQLLRRRRRPTHVIANPVEAVALPNKHDARAALGLASDRPVVAVVAHMHPTKGQHVAVAAWRLMRSPRPLLALAGGNLYGKASDDYRTALEVEVAAAGLGTDVVFLGLVADMSNVYAASDVVVHPALYPEGFGRSIAEAQVAGVPAVATRLGAAPELIQSEHSGLLVPPGDPAALIAAIARVMDESELRRCLINGGFEAATRYRVDTHASAVNRVYEEVTS